MTHVSASTGILSGIRVLDLSRMLSGPYCTMMLADHGAEVIKIESAGGDTSRTNGPFRGDDPEQDWAGYYVSLNRNKHSVQLDLKTDEGKAAFRKLVLTADVVVENFRPGVMERLGLSYESLSELRPQLVYAAIRGFGDPRSGESPYASWPSYDVVAQAMGGIMSLTGPDESTPTKVGPGVGDIFAGLMMSFGIMAVLRQAEATGRGQFVDVAMYDAMISLCERAVYQHDFTGKTPTPEGNGHPLLAPFGLFPAKDGSIALGIVDDAFWRSLTKAMGQPDLGQDEKFAKRGARSRNSKELNALVSEWTSERTKAELTALLGGLVPYGPLNTVSDIFHDPHVEARGMLTEVAHPDAGHEPWTVASNPLRFAGAPSPELQTPPRIGQDNKHYLEAPDPEPMSREDMISLRNAFGNFATGVTVVTTRQSDGTPRGFTANSFSSVSLDPPLLLICVAKTAHSCEVFETSPHFAVNVLSEDQKAVSGLFASRAPDKFEQTDWTAGAAEMPVLDGSIANFVCARHKLVDAGDHIVLIGRVVDYTTLDARPLGYFKGSYFSIGLEDSLVSAASNRPDVQIGAVLQNNRKLLLTRAPDGGLSVPKAPTGSNSIEGLLATLEASDLACKVSALYAVFQESDSGNHGIFYHGGVSGEAPDGMEYLALEHIELDQVPDAAERSMLARYIAETKHGNFGIYQGSETSGSVFSVSGTKPSEH